MTNNPPSIDVALKTSYQELLGNEAWCRLHPDIRQRFSPENYHQAVTYKGVMSEVYLSRAGSMLAQLCRLIGTPLALYNGRNIPTKVDVYPNSKLQGMTWDRFYFYPDKKVNRITSTKCVVNIDLIEVVGFGFGMNLKLYEKDKALVFESTSFFLKCGSLNIKIPDILSPGKTIVQQRALENSEFEFSLTVEHKIFGKMFRQLGVFSALS